jgi:predicted nucleic acid-binding protein
MEYVLDACALIALLSKEDNYEKVDDLINGAIMGEHIIHMHMINLVEVYYGYIEEKGLEEADRFLEPLKNYPLRFVRDITDPIYRAAARFKALYSVSLADSFAAATAKSHGIFHSHGAKCGRKQR